MEISNEIKTITFLSEMIKELNHLSKNSAYDDGFVDTLENTASKINDLYPQWVKISDKEPKKGECVDIFSKARGREADFEYEGNGVFYENNNDETREVEFSKTETQYNVTHWLRVPDCL